MFSKLGMVSSHPQLTLKMTWLTSCYAWFLFYSLIQLKRFTNDWWNYICNIILIYLYRIIVRKGGKTSAGSSR